MANGTDTSGFGFDTAYGYGFDKPISYSFGGGNNQPSASGYLDYDGDYLLDRFPVRPTGPAQPVTPIVGGGGGGEAQMERIARLGVNTDGSTAAIPDQLQKVAMPPGLAGTGTAAAATGGGFGSRFASNMSSPQAMAGMAKGIGGILQGAIGRGARRDAQIKAQGQYDDMLSEYRALDTSNLYADFENQFTGLENAYEDLTVNRQQAEFEKDMFQQQQATIMQGLKGAAGGSGIAGLAQAMANQGQLQAQKAGGSIGLQESKINMLRAQEASRLQQLERTGAMQAEQLRLAGAERARGLDYMQTSTQLGMAQQDLAAKNRAIAQADAALYGGIGSVAGTMLTAGIGAIPTGA